MDLSDYIIIVLVFIIIYLLYNNYIEKFVITNQVDLSQKINNVFKADLSGIRELKPLIDAFDNTELRNIYFTDYNISELVVNNSEFMTTSTIRNLNLLGDLYIKDYTNINLCPRGVIIAWGTRGVPNGWLLCDGKTWWISKVSRLPDRISEPPISEIIYYDKLILPDLRARFILNTFSYGNTYEYGGEEQVTLNFTDMPPHQHYNSKILVNEGGGIDISADYKNISKNNSNNLPVNSNLSKNYYSISYDGHSEDGGDDEYMLPAMYIFPNNPYNSFDDPGNTLFTEKGSLNTKVKYRDPTQIQKIDDITKGRGDMPHDNMPPYHSLIYIMKK